tara:strand:- start:6 stop:785 length:780 start_codon:yes stop_codon:yes gene_type:complete
MKSIQNAIIGGTGIYETGLSAETIPIETEYGTVNVDIAQYRGESVIFLPRHNKKHKNPPHNINYRANLKALKNIGVKNILATFAIGSLSQKLPIGSLVILKDFIDFTKQRHQTFFDGDANGVKHVKMADPYCKYLRNIIKLQAKKNYLELGKDCIYICTEGPRFETKAEIKMMQLMGADVVGMTSVPEVILAKELGICYASIGLVVNMATGIGNSLYEEHEFEKVLTKNKKIVNKLFLDIFSKKLNQKNCSCMDSILNL